MRPPASQIVLVNGIEAWVTTNTGRFAISTQRYMPDVTYPEGWRSIVAFTHQPWPSWEFRLPDGTAIEHEVFVHRGCQRTALRWRRTAGSGACRLTVRPLLSGRDYHALHRENSLFTFDAIEQDGTVTWRPYDGLPPISSLSNGVYRAAPTWYRQFLYTAERDRGLDYIEDLASPGCFAFDVARNEAVLIFLVAKDRGNRRAHSPRGSPMLSVIGAPRRRTSSRRLRRLPGRWRTRPHVLAGFPWFTDWGRDTFIALRGLLLTTGRLAEAEIILADWAGLVSAGVLPNRRSDVATGWNTTLWTRRCGSLSR